MCSIFFPLEYFAALKREEQKHMTDFSDESDSDDDDSENGNFGCKHFVLITIWRDFIK